MLVMKFGGSSVANSERIKNVANIVRSQASRKPVIVVSGLGGITDELIGLANAAMSRKNSDAVAERIIGRHYSVIKALGLANSIIGAQIEELRGLTEKISGEGVLTPKNLDRVMSLGERMSVRIIAAHMNAAGMEANAYDAYDVGMITDSNFGGADVLPYTYTRIRKSLEGISGIPVITGFVGRDKEGNITTLGRGGSDYTACIIGAAICAEEIQIWTNVNGIMTADPRIVGGAKNIREISFDEESELEFLGADTLHPKGIQPAVKSNITVRILNALDPSQSGTVIKKDIEEGKRVASITHKERMSVINVQNPKTVSTGDFAQQVFDVFRKHGIPVDMTSTSRAGVMVIVNGSKDIAAASEDLKKIGKTSVRGGMAKVSVVGKSLTSMPGISGRTLSSMDDMRVEAMSCGSSGISQSFIVKEEDAERAIRLLHDEFFGR